MPTWIMKTGDDTYRLWSTVVDDWMTEPLDREEATAVALTRAHDDGQTTLALARQAAEETMRFVDEHLCSCRARLGESIEIRNGVPVATGGGRLAYHFDSYEDVARFCCTQEYQDAYQ
jgi:hypothetical protein